MVGWIRKSPFMASRRQRPHFDDDESSSDISTRDLLEKLKTEKCNRKETHELYSRLQGDYDELLAKYAQAENTIDQLRIGARLNLYSDLPPPQKSTFVTVNREKQPHVFEYPRSNKAVFSQVRNENQKRNGEISNDPHSSEHSPRHSRHTFCSTITTNTKANDVNLDTLTPDAQAESIRMGLMFQVENLVDDVSAVQENLQQAEWGEQELQEMHEMCRELKQRHAQLGSELSDARRLEGKDACANGKAGYDGDYFAQDSIEGQLYRVGLRLEEISEQLDERLQHAKPSGTDGDLPERPRTNSHNENKEQPHSDVHRLMEKLQRIKESNMKRNEDVFSRSGNSLDDVEDLDLNVEGKNDDTSHREFSLGDIPGDSTGSEQKSQNHLQPPGFDLQESGYFASEAASNFNDVEPSSQPLSSMYFSHSGRPRGGSVTSAESPNERDDLSSSTQLDNFQRHDPHDSSKHSNIEAPRSRSSSHLSRRSRASTLTNQDPDEVSPLSSPDDPSRKSRTDETSPTHYASSNPVSKPYSPTRQDSRLSDKSSDVKRSRSGTANSYPQKQDILRTEHNRRDSHPLTPHSRSPQSSSRSPVDPVDNSPDSSPLQSVHRASRKRPEHQRHSISSVADSRVSTPLFLPHDNKAAKPKDRRTKTIHPATADTERGFDSGFFGSEGSRISRGVDSPELQPHVYLETRPRRQQRQSVTESEEERYDSSSLKTSTRTLPRQRDRGHHRRSRLKSLSETDEERGFDTSLSKTSARTSSQRERRSHYQHPVHPNSNAWSEAEESQTFDGRLARCASSPDLYREPLGEKATPRSRFGSGLQGSALPSRRDVPRKHSLETGTRGAEPQDGRQLNKQSLRGYRGLDRESLRSGRRSRQDADSSSGYSDGERKHHSEPLDKLRAEIAKLRGQLRDEAGARNMQSHLFDDLRRRHDDLEREMARRNAEQQMTNMYDSLRKKYDDMARNLSESPQSQASAVNPQAQMLDDLRKRVEELAKEVEEAKRRPKEDETTEKPSGSAVHFPCPLCGGTVVHIHGNYFYPGYIGTHPVDPPHVPAGTTRQSEVGTQTVYLGTPLNHTRHPSTPVAASTPYHHNIVSSPGHHHTQTYPGTHPGVVSGSPTVHHIHHLPGGRITTTPGDCTDDCSSDEDSRTYRSRRSRSRLKKSAGRRSHSGYYDNGSFLPDDSRLHLSLDEASRAARDMQRLSKRMLNTIASDLIRTGSSRR